MGQREAITPSAPATAEPAQLPRWLQEADCQKGPGKFQLSLLTVRHRAGRFTSPSLVSPLGEGGSNSNHSES